jgi:L-lysine exporter family protein LysE/ArgO
VLAPALAGFALGGGLIVAIGAQNAFVLRLGLLRHHVLAVCLFCAVSDAALIALGVAGFGSFVAASPTLLTVVTWGGVVFLAAYGALALRRALTPSRMQAAAAGPMPLAQALGTCAAFTFLNPHVYLDTVVLVGGLSATWPGTGKLAFGAGAALASFVWFFALGYGARLLQGVFARPRAWQVLDGGIALVMWALALKLAVAALA